MSKVSFLNFRNTLSRKCSSLKSPQLGFSFNKERQKSSNNNNVSRVLVQPNMEEMRWVNLVLRILKQCKWWLASICGSVSSFSVRISWSLDVSFFVRDLDSYRCKMNSDQYIGLHYTEDQDSDENCSSVQELQRATSFTSYYSCTDDDDVVDDDDIDERAEIFISNFRRRLLYERQISQQRYSQVNSFEFLTEIQECFY